MTYTVATAAKTRQMPAQHSAAQSPQQPSAESLLVSRIGAALEHARRLTEMHGPKSIDAALAWETVEELETARARQRVSPTMAFARYCAEYPHAREARIYDC